jgi:hypothetical protein
MAPQFTFQRGRHWLPVTFTEQLLAGNKKWAAWIEALPLACGARALEQRPPYLWRRECFHRANQPEVVLEEGFKLVQQCPKRQAALARFSWHDRLCGTLRDSPQKLQYSARMTPTDSI